MTRPLRIAMVGLKGLPATWGGIERHVEEVGSRLARRGHEVTVFSRTNYADDTVEELQGMRLVHLPTVDNKHLDAIVHSANATLQCVRRPFDVVHYHGVGPGLVAPLVRALRPRSRVVLTVHGLDADRAKWGGAAQRVLNAATWMSARVPHRTVVVSNALADHYEHAYGRTVVPIVNGVNPAQRHEPGAFLDRWGLRPGEYALSVGRLVPEKAPDLMVRAFREVVGERARLVLAGGSSHTGDFVDRLAADAREDPRVLMPGYVHGTDLQELYTNAAVFLIPSLLEGLPLTLLEAISYRLPVIASDIPPHLEVLGQDRPGARLVPPGDVPALAAAVQRALDEPEREGALTVHDEVVPRYSWDHATDRLEQLYRDLVR